MHIIVCEHTFACVLIDAYQVMFVKWIHFNPLDLLWPSNNNNKKWNETKLSRTKRIIFSEWLGVAIAGIRNTWVSYRSVTPSFSSFFSRSIQFCCRSCCQTLYRLKYNTMLCFAFCENSKVLLCQTPYPFLILLAPPPHRHQPTIHCLSSPTLSLYVLAVFLKGQITSK